MVQQQKESTAHEDFKRSVIDPMDHIGLVYSIARKLHRLRPYLNLEDLVQSGFIGLMKACGKFESTRGCTFPTYATWWITTFVRKEINGSDFVHLPTHLHETAFKVRGDEARSRVGNDKITSIGACISEPQDNGCPPDIEVERKEITEKVKAVIAELDESSKNLVLARMEGKTNLEVGKMIGRSHEHARQQTNIAIRRLKVKLVKAGLEEV